MKTLRRLPCLQCDWLRATDKTINGEGIEMGFLILNSWTANHPGGLELKGVHRSISSHVYPCLFGQAGTAKTFFSDFFSRNFAIGRSELRSGLDDS